MHIRYLLDEHMPNAVTAAIHRLEPSIDIIHVGQPGAPPIGTLDPQILEFCEREQRALVTNNRKSMAAHIRAHFNAGREHWGVLEFNTTDIGKIAEWLHTYWDIEDAEAIKNAILYLG